MAKVRPLMSLYHPVMLIMVGISSFTYKDENSHIYLIQGMESFLTSWKDSVKGKLHLDVRTFQNEKVQINSFIFKVLLPTGVLIEMTVEQKMSVYELKSIVLQKVI